MWRTVKIIVITLFSALCLLIVAIGIFDVVPASAPPGVYPSPAGPSPELKQFAEDCQRNVDAWQRGEVVFPKMLTAKLDESVAYIAGVDIRGGNDLERRLNDGGNYSTAPVDVRCGLGARLISASSNVDVGETDWVMQQFEEPGTVEWSWTVKGKKPGEYNLTLQLRPAVAIVGGGYVVPAGDDSYSPTANFVTKLNVTATAFQNLYIWWDENWGKIVAIATALGAAIVGVLAWVRKLRKREAEAGAGTPSQSTESPPSPTTTGPGIQSNETVDRPSPPTAPSPPGNR